MLVRFVNIKDKESHSHSDRRTGMMTMALDLSVTCSGGGQYLQKAENKSMSQISHAGELVLIQAQPDGPQPEKRKNSREPF